MNYQGRSMRVNELARKCVVFLGILDDNGAFAPYGTGFIVMYGPEGSLFGYLVTAKHVLDDMLSTKRQMVARVNDINGEAQVGNLDAAHWEFHPTDPKCDVAVSGFTASRDTFDFRGVMLSDGIVTPEYITEHDIGAGDQVYTTGLLVSHFGRTKNVPIVRIGNIAAMSEGSVDLGESLGHQEVYLTESRSIGGLSGSPVFLQTVPHRIGLHPIPKTPS
ncbi:MAG: hypothetical protein Q8M26_01565 [Pseudolabrys sp.]|nr:hypothetical protein [Pseudolabrys sp.]